jgi:hypothetical protein
MSDLHQRWDEFVLKASYHFKVTANLEFLLFIMGIQESGQGIKAYSKQEKMDIITLARCRLLEMSGFVKQTGTDNEGWPTFDVLKDENELLPSERDKMQKENLMAYFDTHLFTQPNIINA